MGEKFPENNILTSEQMERIAKGAAALQKAEAIRAGDEAPCPPAPGPEEYGGADKPKDRAVLPRINKTLKPPSKFFKMPGAPKNMGWLKAWQDKQERDVERE